jgi:hypothetical protein
MAWLVVVELGASCKLDHAQTWPAFSGEFMSLKNLMIVKEGLLE